ncbi:HK97 family phage prohead protease [Aureimonas sp. AU4]|uniref:HK97 family phage prohead protease n=1 Tax=Aureimonas sp. AU4 TaxID=1638163 RepID=UPI00078413C2|nr:HK97 family phage prohead protease [Aureimonas sp. AU4]
MSAAQPARLDADGTVRGYASLFDRPDNGGDRVERGAFRRSLLRRGAAGIRMLWQHDPARPIGVWTRLAEDQVGLFAEGRLALQSGAGREAFELLRAGAIDGLSIGFHTRRSAPVHDGRARRSLVELDLWEISIVTFPMQEAARVTQTRSRTLPARDLSLRLVEAARRLLLPPLAPPLAAR